MSNLPPYSVQETAGEYKVDSQTVLYRYIERKTKAANRGSKARRSLGNLYALYVLCDDFLQGNENGSRFTDLLQRMKDMPFGAKLQNHPLDNRLNDEIRRQYGVERSMLPVQPTDLGDGRKARRISQQLLSEGGMDPHAAAKFVVGSIDKYVQQITENQNSFLNEINDTQDTESIIKVIKTAFLASSDARLFEIVSYALLHMHFIQTEVKITAHGKTTNEKLTLYRTGRTNANDGGIDFVLKPLGRFFQVTETLDFRKYFLDFDKINRFPLTFVIKTHLTPSEARARIETDAGIEFDPEHVKRYMALFEEIFTLNELQAILDRISAHPASVHGLKALIVESFRLEYGLLD